MKSIDMKRGQKALVCSARKGGRTERKMFEIGIVPGIEIQLLEKHPFRGPLLFLVGQSRIVLGRGIAADLEVDCLTENE